MERLTSSLEDYLEIIYNRHVKNDSIKAIDISKELSISRASVSEALKKLDKKGYINYGYYGKITLTEVGYNTAKEIVSKHKILQQFFEKVLNLDEKEASKNACNIEHIITNNAFKQISKYMKSINE